MVCWLVLQRQQLVFSYIFRLFWFNLSSSVPIWYKYAVHAVIFHEHDLSGLVQKKRTIHDASISLPIPGLFVGFSSDFIVSMRYIFTLPSPLLYYCTPVFRLKRVWAAMHIPPLECASMQHSGGRYRPISTLVWQHMSVDYKRTIHGCLQHFYKYFYKYF